MSEEQKGRSAQKQGETSKKSAVKSLKKKLLQGRTAAKGAKGRKLPAAKAEAQNEKIEQTPTTTTKGRLKVIFLGGVEEIGKNITVLEYAEDIVIVDCGSIFPKEDMLGIDLVIPDVTYLQRNRDKIRGILVTHGHEDHIGAIPYLSLIHISEPTRH